ncbi:DUF6660 family protein [Empedobacter falsenii]
MKFIILIIALYVNVLSFVPCQDTNTNRTQVSMVHSEKDNSDHKDQCSPLCVCNCCQITISSMKFTRLLKTPKVFDPNTSKKIQFKKNTIQNQLYADIWQPPKINIA